MPCCIALPESAEAVACAPRRISGWRQLVSLFATGAQVAKREHEFERCASLRRTLPARALALIKACTVSAHGPCARALAIPCARGMGSGGAAVSDSIRCCVGLQRRAAETAPTWLIAAAKGSGAELTAALRPERSSPTVTHAMAAACVNRFGWDYCVGHVCARAGGRAGAFWKACVGKAPARWASGTRVLCVCLCACAWLCVCVCVRVCV